MSDVLSGIRRTCFSLTGSVDRRTYVVCGFGLALLKYVVEASLIAVQTGLFYTPLDYLTPLLSNRARFTSGAPAWLGVSLLLWSLPFVWISVAMSIRRCRDAGLSPWLGMILLVPLVNYLGMFLFSVFPRRSAEEADRVQIEQADSRRQQEELIAELWQAPHTEPVHFPQPHALGSSGLVAALAGIVAGVLYGVGSTVATVYLLQSYGAAVFFGTPLVSGAVSGFIFNRAGKRSIVATMLQATVMIGCAFVGMLLVGFEGFICILMAAPLLWPIAVMGALIGRSICVESPRPDHDTRGMMWCLGALPALASLEFLVLPLPVLSVATTVQIHAPIDAVWNQVIAFPEITETPDWLFRTGIAYPMRARIDGHGVGAIRHCEFSTGAFVEPVTRWEPPRRLNFDVTEQPEPMFELTPYRHIHPPHLTGSFRSIRGEFLLEEVSPGITTVRGTTWYTLDLHPQSYWTTWTDALLHRIHLRVLNHIKRTAEQTPGTNAAP